MPPFYLLWGRKSTGGCPVYFFTLSTRACGTSGSGGWAVQAGCTVREARLFYVDKRIFQRRAVVRGK